MTIRLNRALVVPLLLAVLLALVLPYPVRAASGALPPGVGATLLASRPSLGKSLHTHGKEED